MKLQPRRGRSVHPERVNVRRARESPIDELDAEFEGGLRPAHDLGFVDAHDIVEILHVREGRFAHPDDADVVGFDEAHRAAIARQQCR